MAPSWLALGGEVACATPSAGPWLSEQGEARGLALDGRQADVFAPWWSMAGGVVLDDLDGDGDLDVALGHAYGLPFVFENDGAGHFALTERPVDRWRTYGDGVMGMLAMHLDDDGLLDWVLLAVGQVRVARSRGGLRWGEPEVAWAPPGGARPAFVAANPGDVDGDGDLDLLLAALEELRLPDDRVFQVDPLLPGHPSYLLRNEAGALLLDATLLPANGPGVSLAAVLTDRDGDGDLDALVLSDRGGGEQRAPTAFFRNDGLLDGGRPRWVDDAAALGFDLPISGMGLANADINGDGTLDYLLADIGRLPTLRSVNGQWARAEAALGLSKPPASASNPRSWFAWSVEWDDLDNDGWLDVVASAGLPIVRNTTGGPQPTQPNGLWRGLENGAWAEVGADVGFSEATEHFGLATGDVDRDGALDVLVAGSAGPAQLWMGRCGEAAWTSVRLAGPAGNPTGLGARVEVRAGDRSWVRELWGSRSMGQGPPIAHFGLGAAEHFDLRVRWPDGTQVEVEQVPVRRPLVVHR